MFFERVSGLDGALNTLVCDSTSLIHKGLGGIGGVCETLLAQLVGASLKVGKHRLEQVDAHGGKGARYARVLAQVNVVLDEVEAALELGKEQVDFEKKTLFAIHDMTDNGSSSGYEERVSSLSGTGVGSNVGTRGGRNVITITGLVRTGRSDGGGNVGHGGGLITLSKMLVFVPRQLSQIVSWQAL
ncbi:hypothetical protein HG531_001596 [Fusarium graminearum]|nr:hypothetical protein HG531_001596 [Fusarium graminearum]